MTRVQPEKPCSNCVVISVNIMHAEDVPRQILSLVSMPEGQSSFVSLDTFETVKTVSSEGWIILYVIVLRRNPCLDYKVV